MKRRLAKQNERNPKKQTKITSDFRNMNEISVTDDLLNSIIFTYIPPREWPNLELVSRQFRRVTLLAYQRLITVKCQHFYEVVPVSWMNSRYRNHYKTKRGRKASEKLEKFLLKMVLYSPKLKSVAGFNFLVSSVQYNTIQYIYCIIIYYPI